MKSVWSFLLVVLYCFPLQISAGEFIHPSVLSFENGISPAIAGNGSVLSVSSDYYKHQKQSLHWQWSANNAWWSIKQPIPYHTKTDADNAVSTFVFWVYATHPQPGYLTIEFLNKDKVCSYFNYQLNFSGWRGAWIAFDRDMQGKLEVGMTEMRVKVTGSASGELYFDHIIAAVDEDARQHTADFQAPFINPDTDNHWLILLKSWNKKFDISEESSLTLQQQKSINIIESRLKSFLLEGKKTSALADLTKEFNQYTITQNNDGSVKGLPVFFERFGETYTALGGPDYKKLYADASGLSKACDLLLKMAVTYSKSTDSITRTSISKMYVQLMRHLQYQGFQAGSAMGTLHHLGYSFRNYYPAAFLMKDVLRNSNLLTQVQQSCEWFSGTGELKIAPEEPGIDIDAFNTSLIGRLVSILLLENNSYKTRYLTTFKRWIDNGFLYSAGTEDGFKPDGSIYHHRHNYPAYAIGGLEGAVTANYLLYGTKYQLDSVGRNHLKNAMLSMRFYCNLQTWPLSLSGRHPDGKGHLIPEHFAMMAVTGNPGYTEKTDKELASAYLRLETKSNTKYIRQFKQAGIVAEPSPEGNLTFNYSCLNVHRRENWSVSAMGFSRYLWNTETYPGANMYGRYLNYGNLQIMAGGNPVSNFGSGFNQSGWDWNHFPGTTATERPVSELKANVINPDKNSGNEEMLLSDEAFAGGLSFQGKQGIFAMKLHENPKYGGNLKARKSYFFFDNRIVCLGSNITGDIEDKPVHTTLFQVALLDSLAPVEVNGKAIEDFPLQKSFSAKRLTLADGLNNYFFVNNSNVLIKKTMQYSFDEETENPTQHLFSMAAIDHGKYPENGAYNYMILVQPNKSTLKKTSKQMSSSSKPYSIVQQDSVAHIVQDKCTGITAYVFFEPAKLSAKTNITSVSQPCLVMESIEKSRMYLSVSDPDLHLYDGKSDFVFDSNGKYIEQSIYSLPWIKNQPKNSVIEIQIKGKWQLSKYNSDRLKIISLSNNYTTVQITCNPNITDTNFVLIKQ